MYEALPYATLVYEALPEATVLAGTLKTLSNGQKMPKPIKLFEITGFN